MKFVITLDNVIDIAIVVLVILAIVGIWIAGTIADIGEKIQRKVNKVDKEGGDDTERV